MSKHDNAYGRRHQMVRRERGPASARMCAFGCGRVAEDWATIHGHTGEDPEDYIALCRHCHWDYDREAHDEGFVKRSGNQQYLDGLSERMTDWWADPENRAKAEDRIREGVAKRSENEQWLSNLRAAVVRRSDNSEWRANLSETAIRNHDDPEWRTKYLAGIAKRATTKLTEPDVREIRKRYAAGGVSQAALAREFGVSAATIGDLIAGRTWRHVK